MHYNSLELFKLHGLPLIKSGMNVLEIGPDWCIRGGLCRPLVENQGAHYSFCDLDNKLGGVPMHGEYSIQSTDHNYDIVFSLNVAEHVRKLWVWIDEQARITKVGGYIIHVNPVSWAYHESPYDCWRIFPEGWKALFEDHSCLEHIFSWTGHLVQLEGYYINEHGPNEVRDTIAIARRI